MGFYFWEVAKMPKAKKFERRDFLFEVRAEQDEERGSILTGRPIVYNSWTDLGWYDEMIAAGALAKTDLTDVRFLVNHDLTRIPLARSRRNNGNSTMQLMPDDDGLGIRVSLDTENNADARALYSAVQRGDITGMSFMFQVEDGGDDWIEINSDHPQRIIRSISRVLEVSAVTFPAYSDTEINARSKETLDNVRAALDSVRQLEAEAVDTAEIELLKAKALFKSKI